MFRRLPNVLLECVSDFLTMWEDALLRRHVLRIAPGKAKTTSFNCIGVHITYAQLVQCMCWTKLHLSQFCAKVVLAERQPKTILHRVLFFKHILKSFDASAEYSAPTLFVRSIICRRRCNIVFFNSFYYVAAIYLLVSEYPRHMAYIQNRMLNVLYARHALYDEIPSGIQWQRLHAETALYMRYTHGDYAPALYG